MMHSAIIAAAGADFFRRALLLPTVLIEDATGGEVSIATGDGVTTLVIAAPPEYAGTYELDGADLASGPVVLKAPVLSEPAEIVDGTVLEVTPALIAWDEANGAMTAEYRVVRDAVVGGVVSDFEYVVDETDEGTDALAVQVVATDGAGSSDPATSNTVAVPEPDTPTPTEMAIDGADNTVTVLTYWTAAARPITGANNEVNATWA